VRHLDYDWVETYKLAPVESVEETKIRKANSIKTEYFENYLDAIYWCGIMQRYTKNKKGVQVILTETYIKEQDVGNKLSNSKILIRK
jgi:hypothetical protein